MAIQNTLSHLRKPIGRGHSRTAFYSRKLDCVIKRDNGFSRGWHDYFRQSDREAGIFRKMTKREKEIFPIIDVVQYKGVTHILMKRVVPLDQFIPKYTRKHQYVDSSFYSEYIRSLPDLNRLTKILGLNPAFNRRVIAFARKYNVMGDLRWANVGMDKERRIVIIDAGY